MTSAVVLAAAAGLAGVLGGWDALSALEARRLEAAAGRLLRPLRALADPGHEPTDTERRRLGLLCAGALLAAGWLLAGPVVAGLLACAGPALTLAGLRVRAAHRTAELSAAAPSVARAMADAVGAGHSPRGALAAAAAGAAGAAGRELRATAQALELGATTEQALERLRRRAASPDWDALVAAVLLQRDAGGDLAALLRRLASSLEQAARQRDQARAATAQARYTAWLVAALPFGAALLGELASPGLIRGLVAEPLSALLSGAALLLQVVAVLCVKRLAREARW